jgi:hypothetical protein
MGWSFEGNGQQIGFSVSSNGVLSAYGPCSQDCFPSGGDPIVVHRMRNIAANWRLCTPASEEHEYDGIGWGLKDVFTKSGGKAVGMIDFDPGSKGGETPLVGLSVLAPNDFAASAFTLLKSAMGNPVFRFVIIADFFGLSVEEAEPNPIPKFADFANPDLLRRRPYFSDTISISVRTFA